MASLNIVIFYYLAVNYPRVEDYSRLMNTKRQKLLKAILEALNYSCLAETQAHKLLLMMLEPPPMLLKP